MLCSTVLTKCFTGLLLNTYFMKKPSLTVDTFEDIDSNPGLSIAGRVGLRELKFLKPDLYLTLNQRLIEYENRLNVNTNSYNDIVNRDIVRDIIDRKAVLIVNSKQTNILKSLYPESNLMESETKYSLLHRFCYVTKNAPNFRLIYRKYEFFFNYSERK